MQVAVIEDEFDLRQLLVEEIEDLGYQVHAAKDGEAGLDLIRSVRPHVICSDINMPGINGLELRDRLEREGLITSATVFVFISSNAAASDIADGLMAGASHYFTKPIDYDRLAQVLEHAKQTAQA